MLNSLRITIHGLHDEKLEITLNGANVQNAKMFHLRGNLVLHAKAYGEMLQTMSSVVISSSHSRMTFNHAFIF